MTAKKNLAGFLVFFGGRVFSRESLRMAWQKMQHPSLTLNSPAERLAYVGLCTAKSMGILGNVRRTFIGTDQLMASQHGGRKIFDSQYINLYLNRVYDLPDVKIDRSRPATINVLVPAFDFRSISAGFFGVFQVARFLRTTGLNVRLVLFDHFHFDLAECKQKLLGYPGLEHFLDEVEVEYIGEKKSPLLVSPHDTCVAHGMVFGAFCKENYVSLGQSALYLSYPRL